MIAKTGISALTANFPGSGAILELIDTEPLAEKAGELTAFIAQKFANNKDKVQLVTKPLKVLTPLLIEDLNQIAKQQTLVLLLDTYEKTGMFFDDWLLSVLDNRYSKQLHPNCLVCIAGRDPLSKNTWIDWEALIVRSELEPFTEAEARLYLANKGIHCEPVIQEILRLSSNGLPVLIAMMAQNAPTSVTQVSDYCEEAVERFLRWETDDRKRKLAENASIPRLLNRDVLAVLTDEEEADGLFNWLKGRSFVIEKPGEGWQYHSIVSQQMIRYRQKFSPQGFASIHRKLESYYEKLSKKLDLTEAQSLKSEIWKKYELERLYHSLCSAPQKSLSTALSKLILLMKADSGEFSQDWAKVIEDAGRTTNFKSLEDWGHQFYISLKHLESNDTELMTDTLFKLLQEVQLEDNVREIAAIFSEVVPLLGFLNEISSFDSEQTDVETELDKLLDRIDEAINCRLINQNTIEHLSEYLELYPDDSEYLLLRGCLYLCLGYLDTSLEDIEKFNEIYGTHNQRQSELTIGSFKSLVNQLKATQSRTDTSPEHMTFPILMRKYRRDQDLTIKKLESQLQERELESQKLKLEVQERELQIKALTSERQERELRIQAIADAMRPRISLIKNHFRDKKYESMKKLIHELHEIDEDKYWLLRAVGEVQLASKEYNSALKSLNAAIKLYSKDSRCQYARSIVYMALDKPIEANNDIMNAIELAKVEHQKGTNWHSNINLALYQLVAGNIDQSLMLYQSVFSSPESNQLAIQDLQDLLQIFPENMQAQKMISFFQRTP